MYALILRKRNREVLFYMGKFHGIPCYSPDKQDAKLYKSYDKAFDVLQKVSGQRFEQYFGLSTFYLIEREEV